MEQNEKIPEKAVLTGDAIETSCECCDQTILFLMQKGTEKFTIGLFDILDCLCFAEEQGHVPELPKEWWLEMRSKMRMGGWK